ncbi:MAG TPA: hypothetical protein VIK25_16825 [Gemmatimonadaceae bacterium]|jgi:hypothetical protein
MIPPEVIVVPAVFGIPAAVILAIKWFRHRERMAELSRGPAQNTAVEERLARIEQAVDAIAIEMERMGEGQRFVTKLLAERGAQLPAARIGEVREQS